MPNREQFTCQRVAVPIPTQTIAGLTTGTAVDGKGADALYYAARATAVGGPGGTVAIEESDDGATWSTPLPTSIVTDDDSLKVGYTYIAYVGTKRYTRPVVTPDTSADGVTVAAVGGRLGQCPRGVAAIGGSEGEWPPLDMLWTGASFTAGSGGAAPFRYLPGDYDYSGIVNNGDPGASSTTILATVQGAYDNPTDKARTQVIDWARNDTNTATLVANINTWVSGLGHSRFVIIPAFHPATGVDPTITDINNALWSTWPANTIPDNYAAGFSTQNLVANNNSGDDLHPNHAGYQIISDTVGQFIEDNGFGNDLPAPTLPTTKAAISLNLDGVDQYISVPSFKYGIVTNLEANYASSARFNGFGFGAWIKVNFSGAGAVFRIGLDGDYQQYFYVAGNANLGARVGGSTITTTGVNLESNTWRHVFWNFRGNADPATSMVLDMWVDGVKEVDGAPGGNLQHTLAGATLGARYDTVGTLGNWINARLFQPALWQVSLSDAEILSMFNNPNWALSEYPQTGRIAWAPDFEAANQAPYTAVPDRGIAEWDFTGINLDAGAFVADAP